MLYNNNTMGFLDWLCYKEDENNTMGFLDWLCYWLCYKEEYLK